MTLHMRHVRHLLGERWALRGIDLRFQPSRVTVIVGPNGAGKTTLLRILAGVVKPTSGRVEANGQALADMSPRERARHVAYAPQTPRLDYPFTVSEVVEMGAYATHGPLRGTDPTEARRIEQTLARTKLLPLADRLVTELSGGEKQRVALARAWAQGARTMLLDEPTASLDLGAAHDLEGWIRGSSALGRSVVVVAHDLEYASRVADRIILLHEGQVVADGPPEKVLSNTTLSRAYAAPVQVNWHGEDGAHIRVGGA